MHTVQLDETEIRMAAMCGVERHIQNLRNGSENVYRAGASDENDWQRHIEGCLAEAALAKYLGLYWPGVGTRGGADVGTCFEARGTSWRTGSLMLHHSDKDERIAYLLIGINGRYTVRGWIPVKDGKKREYWEDKSGKGRPAFFVPQSVLHHPDQEAHSRLGRVRADA